MDLATWFRRWLSAHPLKDPSSGHWSAYTAEVMTKVKALSRPSPAPDPVRVLFPWPPACRAIAGLAVRGAGRRLALAMATAAVVVVVAMRSSPNRLVQQISRDAQVLVALDEPSIGAVAEGNAEALTDDLQAMDALLIAESTPSDDQWVNETMQLLNQLDEDGPEDVSSGASDASEDEWLQELEQLDENALSARS